MLRIVPLKDNNYDVSRSLHNPKSIKGIFILRAILDATHHNIYYIDGEINLMNGLEHETDLDFGKQFVNSPRVSTINISPP